MTTYTELAEALLTSCVFYTHGPDLSRSDSVSLHYDSELPRLPSHLRVHYHAVQTQSTQFNAVSKGLTSSPVVGNEVFQARVAGQKETLFFNCGLWEGHGVCRG